MSKLIINDDGFPVFPETKADLRYVDKAITREEADITSSNNYLSLVKNDKKLAEKIVEQYLKPNKKCLKK